DPRQRPCTTASTTLPATGRRPHESILSSVILPVPFSPTTATSSPAATSRSTPVSTCRRPNDLRTPRAASAAIASAPFPAEPVTASLVRPVPAGQGAARPIQGVLATTGEPCGRRMEGGLATTGDPCRRRLERG